jgi:hypothetical protein
MLSANGRLLQANCVTELLPSRALERAKFLDEYFAKHNIKEKKML